MILRKFALLFSYIFHPMIISLAAFWILIFFNSLQSPKANIILFTCFLFSNLIPIITVIILRKSGKLSDIDASIKEQRILPLTLGIIYSLLGFLALYSVEAEKIVQGLMFCYMTNSIIMLGITRYWKISIHAMGVTGPIAALWVQGYQFPIIMSVIILCVGASRIILKAHNPAQVYTGAALGFLLTFTQLHLFFL